MLGDNGIFLRSSDEFAISSFATGTQFTIEIFDRFSGLASILI
jgi:hypothetical protein